MYGVILVNVKGAITSTISFHTFHIYIHFSHKFTREELRHTNAGAGDGAPDVRRSVVRVAHSEARPSRSRLVARRARVGSHASERRRRRHHIPVLLGWNLARVALDHYTALKPYE